MIFYSNCQTGTRTADRTGACALGKEFGAISGPSPCPLRVINRHRSREEISPLCANSRRGGWHLAQLYSALVGSAHQRVCQFLKGVSAAAARLSHAGRSTH